MGSDMRRKHLTVNIDISTVTVVKTINMKAFVLQGQSEIISVKSILELELKDKLY